MLLDTKRGIIMIVVKIPYLMILLEKLQYSLRIENCSEGIGNKV